MKRVVLTQILFVLAAASLSAAPADIRQGVVAYWPLDGADGTVTRDESPFANDLTLFNMDAGNFVAGQRGNAASFDGVDEYLSRTHNMTGGLPIFSSTFFTVSMWVKGSGVGQGNPPGSVADRRVLSEGSDASTAPLFTLGTDSAAAATRSGVLDLFHRNDANTTTINHVKSVGQVFDDTWRHFAVVHSNSTVFVYVNGQFDSTFTYTRAATTMNITALGAVVRATPGNFYTGMIDDVIFWARALEPSEITDAMNNGLALPIPTTFPPDITSQPVGGTRGLGDRITFSVGVVGTPPFTYQWRKGAMVLPGETAATLTLNNLTVADSGSYTVEVSNAHGDVTSSAAVLTVNPDPAPDLHDSLVNYWPLDAVENGMTPDVASGNHMQLVNMDATNLVPGQRTNSLSFDGVEEYTERLTGFPIYNNLAYSVSFWVNGAGLQTNRQIYAESSTNSNVPLFIIGTDNGGDSASGNVFIRTDGNTAVVGNRNSARTAFDNTWHHVAWVDNDGQAKLYIDGQLDETDYTYTRGMLSLTTTALGAIRRAAVGNHYAGLIDEVATWNRVLTFTEIQELFNEGLEPPTAPSPPEITSQPQGADVLSGVDVILSVNAVGTAPLHFQWAKNGMNIAGENDSTLVLDDVVVADSGSYTVTITNRAGMVTSEPAVVMVTQRPPVPASICIDINHRPGDPLLETGFESFTLDGTGIVIAPTVRNYGGLEVSLDDPDNVGLDSRLRTTPVNMGDFTQEALLRDFVFARGGVGQGLDLTLRHLKPNQDYTMTIWSFDTGSTGNRVADWTANGEMVYEAWTFGGQNLPASNEDYQFTFVARTDADGTLAIQARRTEASVNAAATPGPDFGAFINAFCLEEKEPDLIITEFRIVGGQIELTFESANPQYEHRVQERSVLTAADSWMDLAGVTLDPPDGNSITAHFAYPGGSSTFYQVIAIAPEPYFADDFESPDGWTHGGTGDSWELGTPTTGPGAAHSGVNAWGTDLDGPYANNTSQWLRSPVINLTSASAATLEFYEFRDVEPLFLGEPVDYTTVRILSAADPDGAPLVELARNVGTQTQWTRRAFALPPEALGVSVIVEFRLTSDDFQPAEQAGWYIDDVSILRE